MRLIDVDEVKEDFSEILEHDYEDDYARGFQAALVAVLGCKAITPSPNAPLTLEELREMEGKPVPVWCDKENGYIFIAATKTEPYNQVWYFNHKGFVHTVLYYSTKFYRRKPEEGTT